MSLKNFKGVECPACGKTIRPEEFHLLELKLNLDSIDSSSAESVKKMANNSPCLDLKCPHCSNRFWAEADKRGSLRAGGIIFFADESLKGGASLPSFLEGVTPDYQGQNVKGVVNDGVPYMVFFNPEGGLDGFAKADNLITNLTSAHPVFVNGTDETGTRTHWKEYYKSIEPAKKAKSLRTTFDSTKVSIVDTLRKKLETLDSKINPKAKEIEYILRDPDSRIPELHSSYDWLVKNDRAYVKSRIDFLGSLSDSVSSSFAQSISDKINEYKSLTVTSNELNGLKDSLRQLNELTETGIFFKNNTPVLTDYINNKMAGVNVPSDGIPKMLVSAIDNFFFINAKHTLSPKDADDLYNQLIGLVNDGLSSSATKVGLDFANVTDINQVTNAFDKLIAEKSALLSIDSSKYQLYNVLISELESLKYQKSYHEKKEIEALLKGKLGTNYNNKDLDFVMNELSALASPINELNSINSDINRFELSKNSISRSGKLKFKNYSSKSKGYTLVDLTNSSEVLVFFDKRQTTESINEAVRNLKTLISDKFAENSYGFFESADKTHELTVKILGNDSEIKYVRECMDYENKEFNDNFNPKDDISEPTESIVTKLKGKVRNLLRSYAIKSRKLGVAKGVILGGLEALLGAVLGVPTHGLVSKYIDVKSTAAAISAPYNKELPDPNSLAYQERALADAEARITEANSDLTAATTDYNAADASYNAAISEHNSLETQGNSLISGNGEDIDGDGILDAGEDKNGNGQLDKSYDELTAEANVLRAEADLLDNDYVNGFANGNARQVFDAVDTYEQAVLGVDEVTSMDINNPNFGSAGIDEERLFTDESYAFYVGHEHVDEVALGYDVDGDSVLETDADNPFYRNGPNWSEEQKEGIDDIIDYYSATGKYAQAEARENLASDLKAIGDDLLVQAGLKEAEADGYSDARDSASAAQSEANSDLTSANADKTSALNNINGTEKSVGLKQLLEDSLQLASAYRNEIIVVGSIMAAIGVYGLYKFVSHKVKQYKEGPLGAPTRGDLAMLTRAVPGEDEHVALKYVKETKPVLISSSGY